MPDLWDDLPDDKQGGAKGSKPPHVVDVLNGILASVKIPDCMPQRSYEAANLWIRLQDNPGPQERVHPVRDNYGNIKGWRTPYHDRLAANLELFCKMPPAHQVYIMEHMQQGIPWRGDKIEMYSMIVEQHKIMLKNPEKYIANTQKIVGLFFNK